MKNRSVAIGARVPSTISGACYSSDSTTNSLPGLHWMGSLPSVTEQLRDAETHAQPETGKGGVTLEMVRQLLDATDQEDGKR